METYIGILSGTSLDAIDVVGVNFDNPKPRCLFTESHPLPEHFKQSCLDITQTGQIDIHQLGTLDAQCGELFAKAILTTLDSHKISQDSIQAIGSHGINLCHSPNSEPPFTLQIGDPNIIAERTKILTVADFRRRDIAAGGQGAPLAPIMHEAFFKQEGTTRVIVNIGGIANISILSKEKNQAALGFDTGPGNCLLDDWVQKHFATPFDINGTLGARGKVHVDLLHTLLADPYFKAPMPKSTGREYFNLTWVQMNLHQFSSEYIPPEDILATLYALSAMTIADQIKQSTQADEIYVCGGGAKNPYLIELLNYQLQKKVHKTDVLGIAHDWVEGILFAFLAKQALHQTPVLLPNDEGHVRPVLLGGVYGQFASSDAKGQTSEQTAFTTIPH